MFYVVRKGEGLDMYHASFASLTAAVSYANNLTASFGHFYNIIRTETAWTTPPATTVADLRKQGVL